MLGAVAAMTVGRGGLLFWEPSSNRCEVHLLSGNYPRLDLDELRDVPGVHWNLEQKACSTVHRCDDADCPLRDWA